MSQQISSQSEFFIPFKESVDDIPLPEKFTFPFYYTPHPLSIQACKELQTYLRTQTEWDHNFGLDPNQSGLVIGKMFGVLVVQNEQKELGYLAAFSGKLAGQNNHKYFVPPIFDMLAENSFFLKEEAVLNALNAEIERLEKQPEYLQSLEQLKTAKATAAKEIEEIRLKRIADKKLRKAKREEEKNKLSPEAFELLRQELAGESIRSKNNLMKISAAWKNRLDILEQQLNQFTQAIAALKQQRKNKSGALQKKLFDQYHFLNIKGERKSLESIFQPTVHAVPPAGSGECAAPKLLQYAFKNQLQPIALAEFWWGQSPKSEIRRQAHFYPACRGKCEPILGHMLEGMEVDENPMLTNPALGKIIETIYEDEHLLVINKPAEFLSVPGKNIQDSVASRMKQKFPNATGPLVVHRLDMSTSGLMLIAKSPPIHKYLQRQFINRKVKKRYVALLDGIISQDEGIVDLPLRVDLYDRPRQMVCQEHGKSARTEWRVIERKDQRTRIHFFPITGRTHQLRVHAAHVDGLHTPILGDDLYGVKGKRLHLHAEWIEFQHPVSREIMSVEVAPTF